MNDEKYVHTPIPEFSLGQKVIIDDHISGLIVCIQIRNYGVLYCVEWWVDSNLHSGLWFEEWRLSAKSPEKL